jgi:2-phospho-L-lactate guanylyltransferase
VTNLAGVQATVRTYDRVTHRGSVLLDNGVELPFDAAAFAVSGLRVLRLGQRVRIRVAGEGLQQRVSKLTLSTFPMPD